MHILHVLEPGRMRYADALVLQQRMVELRHAGRISDTLILLEHEPVITLGRNAHRANILASDGTLAARGIELCETNRGGDVTYHGPGQLVGYPIVDLRGDFPQKRGPYLGPVDYVRLLEEVLMHTCADFGVATKRISGCTGVWSVTAPEKKLAAIGVHVSVGITSHGFALNVASDARGFDCIIPCGITTRGVTSLQAEMEPTAVPTLHQAAENVVHHFAKIFARTAEQATSLDLLAAPSAAAL